MEKSIKAMHTRLMKEILASLATSLYRHRGIEMKRVAIRTTTSLWANADSGLIPKSLMITFVTIRQKICSIVSFLHE
ncbi:unnamed protein product [Acanthoscelides obtectus]|uniref:Uncharacterized protein n=1 Tax=Acanthoscelides obtectus TaxID=200917 RepID=A0A9P0VS47_ACAOB|nr:unnamed protein product [Acanthoscelides obtectus]CAK1649153.1 hypothetical protein AOBTE_LOCUS16076 [Acanthoscelides obtectus]